MADEDGFESLSSKPAQLAAPHSAAMCRCTGVTA